MAPCSRTSASTARPASCELDDDSLTENTRSAYPIDFIRNASPDGMGGHPKNVIMLSADAFGVLPPISRLTRDQAIYYFLSGYTSKLAGTERGITEPGATFSTCFGAPFIPLPPALLRQAAGREARSARRGGLARQHRLDGGPYGVGKRIAIPHTRAMVACRAERRLRWRPVRDGPERLASQCRRHARACRRAPESAQHLG